MLCFVLIDSVILKLFMCLDLKWKGRGRGVQEIPDLGQLGSFAIALLQS